MQMELCGDGRLAWQHVVPEITRKVMAVRFMVVRVREINRIPDPQTAGLRLIHNRMPGRRRLMVRALFENE